MRRHVMPFVGRLHYGSLSLLSLFPALLVALLPDGAVTLG
jgi:hypothetical protein